MGLNPFKTIKPSKKKRKLLEEQLYTGKILRVNDGTDNKKMMEGTDNNDTE